MNAPRLGLGQPEANRRADRTGPKHGTEVSIADLRRTPGFTRGVPAIRKPRAASRRHHSRRARRPLTCHRCILRSAQRISSFRRWLSITACSQPRCSGNLRHAKPVTLCRTLFAPFIDVEMMRVAVAATKVTPAGEDIVGTVLRPFGAPAHQPPTTEPSRAEAISQDARFSAYDAAYRQLAPGPQSAAHDLRCETREGGRSGAGQLLSPTTSHQQPVTNNTRTS